MSKFEFNIRKVPTSVTLVSDFLLFKKESFILENALATDIFSLELNRSSSKTFSVMTLLSSYYFLASASPPRHLKFPGSFLSLTTRTDNLILVCEFSLLLYRLALCARVNYTGKKTNKK